MFKTENIQTPAYVVVEELLVKNLEILQQVKKATNCKILLAQKAFSMFHYYPLIANYLDGVTASGLFEAKLGHQHFKKENHVFAAAYRDDEMAEIVQICDHISFNSAYQWHKFKEQVLAAGRSCSLRINPECSTQEGAIYDPCAKGSRLGITAANFSKNLLDGLDGLHFHTLCEQNADALCQTLAAVEQKFGAYLPQMRWLNFGGGHHISRADYDLDLLINLINKWQNKYDLQVYLEPGEAIALNAGFLVTKVLDIIDNDLKVAILDTSAACHMPDVLEMPYRPPLVNSGVEGEKAYDYRLGGPTCLAGDIIGDYSFDQPLKHGDILTFADMAIYSFVKNNTFNGINLPCIYAAKDGDLQLIKQFGYPDFYNRLS